MVKSKAPASVVIGLSDKLSEYLMTAQLQSVLDDSIEALGLRTAGAYVITTSRNAKWEFVY